MTILGLFDVGLLKFFITSGSSLYCTVVENRFILFSYLVQHFSYCCLPVMYYIKSNQINIVHSNKIKETYTVIFKRHKSKAPYIILA